MTQRSTRNFVEQIVTAGVLIITLVANSALAMPPIESLYGAYEILGRGPGDSPALYRGWVRLAVEGGVIEVDRCVASSHSSGLGRVVTLQRAESQAVEFEFPNESGRAMKASCTVTTDFDNLPRFACYTTAQDDPTIAVPGIESLYPIVWPVALNYFDCD